MKIPIEFTIKFFRHIFSTRKKKTATLGKKDGGKQYCQPRKIFLLLNRAKKIEKF